jgi:transposase-like protein
MLPYFPAFYPNELLHSILARYHRHTGANSPKRTLDDLFGNRHIRAGIALQAGLGALAERLPSDRGLTAGGLAADATLLPYLTAFQPAEVRDWALAAVTKDGAGAVNMRLGLAASVVRLPDALRYCPACRAEMLDRYGELYWRRDHQLPGVLMCPDHRAPLADAAIVLVGIGRHEFVAADEINCPADPLVPRWAGDRRISTILHDIACASGILLQSPPPERPFADWADHYHLALVARGLGRGNMQIDQTALINAFLTRFGPALEAVPDAAPNRWLPGIIRRHRKAFAPLHHVLTGLLIEALPLAAGEIQPFGQGPWPCRNPLAGHCGRPVITDCATHREGGKMIGTFRCNCGYTFSQAAETHSRMRILNLGSLFDARLRELVAEAASLRGTARALAVDAKTVLRRAKRLGLSVPWKLPTEAPRMAHIERNDVRARWSFAHTKAPELSRKQLRGRLPAEYAWLYRHDQAWLRKQPPLPYHATAPSARHDWPTLDAATAAKLSDAAVALRTTTPLVPVTRAALQRALGRPDWIDRRRRQLPLSAAELGKLVESIDDFQKRRVAWVAEELRKSNRPVLAWRIRRLAGLPKKLSADVAAALQAAM